MVFFLNYSERYFILLLNYHFDLYNVCVPLYIRTGTIFFVCTKSEMSKLIPRSQEPTDEYRKAVSPHRIYMPVRAKNMNVRKGK